ncbi:sugar kinase [Ruegeria atlantica]|uniref:sugar kinase n=1 Tax=Ruegeria atlantica TaxID=81569 RepID=UPI0024951F21|nr:sugar kinase [Ruegeria atlantica]
MTDLICLGEPLFELTACPDGSFKGGFGGDVSNVAVAAARQGTKVALITRIGGDQFGKKLRSLWSREGVNHEHVEMASGEDTGLYFVFHNDDGHHFVYRRKGSAASRMLPNQAPNDAISGARMFYTSGISLGGSPELRSTTLHSIQTAYRSGTPFAFDPNLRTALWPLDKARQVTHDVMKRCNIALPGLDDARQLTGLHSPGEIISFYHNLGADIVALSLGADGVSVSEGQGIHTIPGVMVKAVDATGAGDCFNGIFLSAYLKSKDVLKSAELANQGAARSTTGYGAVDPIPYGKT